MDEEADKKLHTISPKEKHKHRDLKISKFSTLDIINN